MKKFLLFTTILLLLIGISFLVLYQTMCQNTNKEVEDTSESVVIDSTSVEEEAVPEIGRLDYVPPPKDELAKNIEQKQTESSPFKDLGCCTDEGKRQTSNCCCNLVLKSYETLLVKNDKKLSEIVQKDPILGFCREKMRKEFDAIENPPSEEDAF
jgi:hypothetical protein